MLPDRDRVDRAQDRVLLVSGDAVVMPKTPIVSKIQQKLL
jgi:hypothetical protein